MVLEDLSVLIVLWENMDYFLLEGLEDLLNDVNMEEFVMLVIEGMKIMYENNNICFDLNWFDLNFFLEIISK